MSHSWSYRKCFQLPTIKYDVNCRCVVYGLYYLDIGVLMAQMVKNLPARQETQFLSLGHSCLENSMDRGV